MFLYYIISESWNVRAFDVVRVHVKSSRKQLKIIHELRLPFFHNLSEHTADGDVDFCMQRLISERMWKMNTLELRFTSSHLILRELAAFTNTTSIPTTRGSHWGSGRERSHLSICSMGDKKSLMPPPCQLEAIGTIFNLASDVDLTLVFW